MDSSPVQHFISIDISDPSDKALIEEQPLYSRSTPPEESTERIKINV
jgi:hypothetical protein